MLILVYATCKYFDLVEVYMTKIGYVEMNSWNCEFSSGEFKGINSLV